MSRLPKLFEPATFRSVTARNRIVVAPMCQYSAHDGLGTDWHVQHLGARAVGGAGIVLTEATHVSALGRITPGCLGLWDDAQQAHMKRLAEVITMGGAVPGVQIAHAGRKASSQRPWEGGAPIPVSEGGWVPWGPSALPFSDKATVPHVMSETDITQVVGEFRDTAARIRDAGYKVIEVHAAHGYLIHSFLSPLSNTRNDQYGGDLAGRARMLLEVVAAIRTEWPDDLPLFVRLSCTDWMEGGLDLAQTLEIARLLKATGAVDLIDCSTGGILAQGPVIPSLHPGYQVPYAEAVRREVGIPTGAVGLITTPEHAEEILGNGRADLVFVARAILADPIWPLRAAIALGALLDIPGQYQRAGLGRR